MAACTALTPNGRCRANAILGGTVCVAHGGRAPQVKAKAAERVLEERARKLIPDTVTVHPNPVFRLLELAAEADEFRSAVAELVNDLKSIRYRTESEQLRSEVVVYERALDRAGRLYLDICKLNLEERLVQIREAEAKAMLVALERALAEAGLTSDQQQQVKRQTARHLRAA